MGDQADVEAAQAGYGAGQHGFVGLQVVHVQGVGLHLAGATGAQVVGYLAEFLFVARHQEETGTLGGPLASAGCGDGGTGADDQDILHAWVTRFQKRERRAGSRSASTCCQAG